MFAFIYYFSVAQNLLVKETVGARRVAHKGVGLNSFFAMKRGMANYRYLCLEIT